MEIILPAIFLAIGIAGIVLMCAAGFYELFRGYRRMSVLRVDRRLATLKKKYHAADATDKALNGRLQASLQLAFYQISRQVSYAWDDGSATGIYELAETNGYRRGINMTVHMRTLGFQSPHMYIDKKKNNSVLKRDLPQKLENARIEFLEGYISDKFNIYAPPGYSIDGLVIGAPDVLDVIDRNNLGADIEILGNQLYMIFPGVVRLDERLEEIMKASQLIADAVDDNLSRYIDDRARGKKGRVAPAGKRLIRR